MTFIFFIFIILAVTNLIILAYNFNLAQRTAWECARRASIGASNNEIREVIYNQFISKMFTSPFLQTRLTFDSRSFVYPNDQFQRVQSMPITINMGFRAGISFLLGSSVTANFPVTSKLYMIAPNDADRDGLYDTTTSGIITQTGLNIDSVRDTRPYTDHDNDGLDDITADTDDDGDSRADSLDFGTLKYDRISNSYELDTGSGFKVVPVLANGRFCARPIFILSNGVTETAPLPLFPMAIPRDRYLANGDSAIQTIIDLSYDKNNDGWEDKFDSWVYK